ncbi:MAG: hypothetical protein KAQ71_13910, partial [Desulfobulbaceae bacterium]|nr:hypothetical protein [Desulfobulbaceae bacterium]
MIQNHKINPKPEFRIFFRIFVIALVVIVILPVSAFSGDKKTKILTVLPQQNIPQPQFFCGYCHILTYPGAVQKGYDLWKKGKHNKYGCVECHYTPKKAGSPGKTSSSGTLKEN